MVAVSKRPSRRALVVFNVAVLGIALLLPVTVSAADPIAGAIAGPVRPEPGWNQDSDFLKAKREGRVVIDAAGKAVVLSSPPVMTLAAPAVTLLDTTVIKKVWEPLGTGGRDNNSKAYTDKNYWNLCAPGGVAVALYYFPASRGLVTGIAGSSYVEPNSAYKTYSDGSWYASTFWYGSDGASNGRGLMMYLAYYLKPTGRTWTYRGIFDWTKLPGQTGYGTPQNRVLDALNWEASGRTTLAYFYVWTKASSLTATTFHNNIVSTVGFSGKAVLVAARTTDGTRKLPQWSKTGSRINHTIAVVGYDDTKGTYSVMDTCGPGCNNTGLAVGVRTISQTDLWTLVTKETDDDGMIW